MTDWRERLLGDRDRLGWWTLPVFAMVGLAGAVLAGSLASVYYAQQVDALEQETRGARQNAERAAEEVLAARDDALTEIEVQVDQVRDALSGEPPFEDVTANGIVVVRAYVGSRADGAPAGDDQGTAPMVQEETEPAPSPPPVAERYGTGFAVALEDGVAFFATTFGVVADPDAPGGVVQRVEVETPAGRFPASVHSWDAGRDLALVRAEAGEVTIVPWRPRASDLEPGSRIVLAGVTPSLDGVQLEGTVAVSDIGVLVTDLPAFGYLRGAPIVDARGHVVGVFSTDYAAFGSAGGDRQGSVPVQLLCERMLRSCETLEAEPTEEPSD